MEACAKDLEERLREWELESLSLDDGARESGFSYSTLQHRVASGEIPNAGSKGRPRVRRCDLPYRGGRVRPKGEPDLADESFLRSATP